MTASAPSPSAEVLRDIRFDAVPLRLGRAVANAAPSTPAAPVAVASAEEQALREARAASLREAAEEGLRSGRAEGLREGRAQAADEIQRAVQRAVAQVEQQWQAELERLQALAQRAQEDIGDAVAASHDEIVALCFETLCRVVGATALRPQFVQAQLQQVLQEHGAAQVVLHLHPQDHALVQRREGGMPDLGAACVPDPEVGLGGCIVRLATGALDARLESMLAACKAVLLETRAQAAAPVTGEGA